MLVLRSAPLVSFHSIANRIKQLVLALTFGGIEQITL